MAIINITTTQTGLTGVLPSLAYINTSDTESEILATGYLNQEVQAGASFSLPCIAAVTTQATPTSAQAVGWFRISHVGANWSLVATTAPGSVALPTIANHIATYTDVFGSLSEDPATAISGGNIQAGLSGTAGYLASFPGTASKGSLRVVAVANTGDTLVTLSNALHGQASVYSIPDSGAATANIIISKLTGTQHITVGGLQVDAGVVTSGISTGGQVGSFAAFPTTATSGSIRMTAAVNATGDFSTTITNALAVAQSQVITIPDSGASTANFLLSKLTGAGIQHITSGSLEVDAGSLISGIATGGTVGTLQLFPTTASKGSLSLQAVANTGDTATIITNAAMGQATTLTIPDIGASTGGIVVATTAIRVKSVAAAGAAGGAAAQSFTDTFCTSGSNVIGNWNTQTNPASVLKIVPGNGSFVVTSSADAGVGTFNYIITK